MSVRPEWVSAEIEGVACFELIGLPYYEQVLDQKPRYAVAQDLSKVYTGYTFRGLPVKECSLEKLKVAVMRLAQHDLMCVLSRVQESLGMVDLELREVQRSMVLAPAMSAV